MGTVPGGSFQLGRPGPRVQPYKSHVRWLLPALRPPGFTHVAPTDYLKSWEPSLARLVSALLLKFAFDSVRRSVGIAGNSETL